MNDPKIKQQIAEKIKNSSNILVTVSTDPSVDALSAALGLTVMLNKLGKHATAVFSGAIPPAITFLDPEKTFENTVDSLRDFIIALDKEKADHLRYKVEGDVVKIFITPYRTTITNEDLEFSQGDYNVELVLALGVDNQEHLDSALEAHGRILHDATVITMSAGEQVSDLGSLDWHDAAASSLSEMLVSLSESIKEDKPLLDEQTATAFLTGIVAATDRFSNPRTSSRVMTMAAQLMAAGADQQLIAAKLEESHEINTNETQSDDTRADIPEGTSVKLKKKATTKQAADGGLSIDHIEDKTLDEIAEAVAVNNQQAAATEAEEALAEVVPPTPVATSSPAVTPPPTPLADAYAITPPASGAINWTPGSDTEPSLGGTLNATTEQAADDARKDLQEDQNKTILTHSYLGDTQAPPAEPSGEPTDPFAAQPISSAVTSPAPAPEPSLLSGLGEKTIQPPTTDLSGQPVTPDHDEARAAVEAALSSQPVMAPSPFNLPPPPPLPDFSQLPPPPTTLAPAYAFEPSPTATTPERLGDILAPEPPSTPNTPPAAPAPNDPSQFRIPGQ